MSGQSMPSLRLRRVVTMVEDSQVSTMSTSAEDLSYGESMP
ncbi:MAG: hypothetical protein ACLTT1_16195 [[Clostridium] scindens]